jgi:hypothetical protein
MMAGDGMASRDASNRQHGDADPHRRRERPGDEDPAGVAQLSAGRIAQGRHQVGEGAGRGQPRGEPCLEAAARRKRPERRAQRRGGIDQRRQLRPGGGLASGQEAIDGLIQAFGRRARWQGF